MSTSTNQTTQVNSSMFTVKPMKLKASFKSHKQAMTTLENARKGAEASKRRAQERKEKQAKFEQDRQQAHARYYERISKGEVF